MVDKGEKIIIGTYDVKSQKNNRYVFKNNDVETNGYHTTFKVKIEEIKKDGFISSESEQEWLGKGIYFWAEKKDSFFWSKVIKDRNTKADKEKKIKPDDTIIITCLIKCKNNEFIDLDKDMNVLEEFRIQYLDEMRRNADFVPKFKNDHERKCFYCNEFKSSNNIKVISYSFPYIERNELGFKKYYTRRQICVESMRYIKIEDVEECQS